MPALRTDDGPRKLRAVWLGPKGAALPFEWTYVQWAVVLLFIPAAQTLSVGVLAVLSHLLTGSWNLWFALPIGFIGGGLAGIWAAVAVMRNVTFDEPVRHKISVLSHELGRKNRTPRSETARWDMPWPTIRDITPPRGTP